MQKKAAKGTETKQKMIQAAAELFHKNGVKATSVDQVLEASHTGKSQFYHYFESKEGLVHAVLEHYCESMRGGCGPAVKAMETWDDLENYFRFHIEKQKEYGFKRGCPIGTIANEIESNQELIRQDLNLFFELMKAKLAGLFLKLKAQGRIVDSADPEEMADLCIIATQGGSLISKVRRNGEAVESAVRHLMKYLKSFSK